MAKKSRKKPKGSAKAEDPSSANPKPKAVKPVAKKVTKSPATKSTPAKKTSRPKKSDISCQFCHKSMKDEKTRKVHERSCKAKQKDAASPPQKDKFETAILELKDHFNDEVMSMSRTMQEREEHHQMELDEVKTVLRMEIDRHRKELERISKSEKDAVSEIPSAASAQVTPTEQAVTAPMPTENIEPHQAPARAYDSRPRAIDMIPLPIPSISRRKFHRVPDDESIPEIEEDEFDPATVPKTPGLSRSDIKMLVKDIIGDFTPQTQTSEGTERLTAKMDQFSGKIDFIESKLERSIMEIRKNLEKITKDSEFKRIEKEMEKISEKVLDIMEDSGFGESLSVTKIPPTILEIVYQAILDDIHIEIIKTKGAQDAEKIARSALEEVRLKTSGSELFKFDGRKIVTDSLAKSIEANMISAKQIQTTYNVLLDKLLETVPHHKAKNFKGMIKIKSQEFAVDRATKLTKEFTKLDKILETTNQMVAAMAANFSTRNLELHEMLTEMRDNTLATKADREEIEQLKSKVQENNERNIKLADELALLRAELEMKEKIKSQDEGISEESDILLAPGEIPFPEFPAESGVDSPVSVAAESEPKADDVAASRTKEDTSQHATILDAIQKGISSKTAIMKETGLENVAVAEALASLVEQRKIIEKKVGKRVKYTTLEKELEEKLKSEPIEEKKKPTAKKGKKSAKKESEKKPKEQTPVDTQPEPVKEGSTPEESEKKPPTYDFERQKPLTSKKKAKKEQKPAEPAEPKDEPVSDKPSPKEDAPKKKAKAPTPKKKKVKSEPPPKKAKPEKEEVLPVIKDEKPAEVKEEHAAEVKPEEAPVAEAEAPPEEIAHLDELPVIRKTLAELSEDEMHVLNVISEEGMTVSGIQSKVGKHLRRFALLRALRVLIDSGHVGILTKGRLELYQKINVEKMDKMKQENKQKEVK